MKIFSLPFYYVAWHYTRGVVDIWQTYTNILWFIKNFFSFNTLLKTLFSPWQRLRERYNRRNGLGDLFASLFINTLMRILGFIIRIITLVIGVLFYTIVLIVGMAFIVIWFILPPFLVFMMIAGILAIMLNKSIDFVTTTI